MEGSAAEAAEHEQNAVLEPHTPGLLDALPAALLVEVLRHLPIIDLARSSSTAAAWRAAVLQVLQRTECVDLIACYTRDHGGQKEHLRLPAVKQALEWALSSGRLPALSELRASGWGMSLAPDLGHACKGVDGGSRTVCRLQKLCIERDPGLELALPLLLQCWGATLRHLSLPKCRHLDDAACELIGRCCPGLLSLDASNWDSLTDAGVAALAKHCTSLQELRINGALRMQDEGLAALASHCRQLRGIRASGCLRLTDASVRAFSGHPALEVLVFKQMPRIHDIGLLATCPSLMHLDVSGCAGIHNHHLQPLLEGTGHKLQALMLNGCTSLTADIGQDIAACCPVLQELDVSRIMTLQPAAAVAPAHGVADGAGGPGEVPAEGAAGVGAEAVAAAGATETGPNLRAIGAVHVVPKLQRPPGMLSMLAAGINSLRVLRLVWCKANDAELCAIVVANPHLRELNLEGQYDITDASLLCIAKHCPDLGDLNIRMCHKLSTPGIVASVADLKSLKHIWLSGIADDQATTDLVGKIKNVRPGCTTHW